ncbi:hypothetical protein V9T40_002599 [Parthenolecanium corni]|uniref:Peptidase M13 N-terminal domain-containing protein n=1 Tax=Parthenolecanium corni TaxID=536013 RepID=A0AAN9Y3X5_9HEMI
MTPPGPLMTYGLETVGNHLAMVDLPDVPPFHQNPPDSYDVISTLAKVHRYSPSTTFLFDIDVRSDPQNFKANRITFGPTPSSINAHVKYDNQPKNDFELTTEKIREALVQNITKTVNFVYEKEGLKLNEEQNTKKNGSIQDVANFLIELEQIRNTDRFTSFQAWKYESLASLQDFTEKNLQGGEIQIYWYEYFEALFQGITNFGESERRGGLNWTEVMIMNPAQLLKVLKLLQRTSRHINWMIENIRESLAQIIQQSPWMDGNSKSDALLKLSMITTKVGYFDEKPDLRRIDQFYQNVDGHATLSQNIADSIGFEVALKAYRNLVRDKGLEPFLEPAEFTDERGRQHQHIVDHEQLFTLAYASVSVSNTLDHNAVKNINKYRCKVLVLTA